MRNGSAYRAKCLWVLLACSALGACSNPVQPGGAPDTASFDYRELPQQVAELELGNDGRNVRAADLNGNHLVIANYRGLTVVDVGDPSHPQIREQVELQRNVQDLAVLANEILIVDYSGLYSYPLNALSDPPTPGLTFDPGETPTLIRMVDRCFLATTAGAFHYLYLLDIADPSKPMIQSKLLVGAQITDVAQEQNLVLLGTKMGGVFLDISNPEQIEILSTIGKGEFVALANGFAYVNGTERGSSGVTVLDVHDPRRPVEIGSSLAPTDRGRMLVKGSRLFVDAREQIEVIDVVDRRHLRPEGSIPTGASGGSFFRDEYVWSIDEVLTVHRLGSTMSVPVLGETGILVWSQAQLQDGVLYGLGAKGFFSMNVRDPSLTAPQNYLPGSYSGWRLVDADRVYVYSQSLVVSIHQLASGNLLGSIDLTGQTSREDDRVIEAVVQNEVLCIVVKGRISKSYELFVVDVGQPQDPQIVGHLLREGDPRVFVRGVHWLEGPHLAVVADGFNASPDGIVDIIDVSWPQRPQFVSQTRIKDPVGEITASRGFLYVATDAGIVVLDARDLSQPTAVAQFGASLQSYQQYVDLVVKDHVLYAMSRNRMEIVDVSNPRRPRPIATRGHLSTNYAERLLAGDGVLYAIMNYGIQALPLHASR